MFHSKTRGYYYKNPEADRLIDLGRGTLDPKERVKVYQQLHRFLRDDAPWVFLYNQLTYFGVRRNVKWEAPADTLLQMYYADKE
ncbi:MAG: hypothetical protein M1602_01755 [Firmicutes bacterium]|nr:hypothetical protein [Bacillota bacterium]